MTAEQYVRDVGKLLKCRASKKKEIKKQLLSEINSAVAKGETLEEVLKRMGIAWDCAIRYNDNFDRAERRAAKRERILKIWMIVLLAIVAVFAFSYRNLPRWSDISESTVFSEGKVKAEAEALIRLYSDNDFQAVTEHMNADMRKAMNASTLQYTKSLVKEEFGTLQSIGDMSVSEADQNGKKYAMVQVDVSYSDINVSYTITLDEDMRLAGFYVK